MNSIQVHGGVALCGKVCIQGSKNAALPILAATLLTKETTFLLNCPRITDVHGMISLLKSLGMKVNWEENGVRIEAGELCKGTMQGEAIRGMRSSLFLLGALIATCGEATMEYPGGCMIGKRPIDIHLSALRKMGVCFCEEDGLLKAKVQNLHGAMIELPFPSVGATENIILAAVMAEGETQVIGAAREPEVEALCRYLMCCGADIEGAGTSCLKIRGGNTLFGVEYRIPEDRIVAGTYLFATMVTGGCTLLEHAPVGQMDAVIRVAEQMGAVCHMVEEGLYVQAPEEIKAIGRLQTKPYPGFPTDLQSMALVAASLARGETDIEEQIFENRFQIVDCLNKMGADIRVMHSGYARVKGVERLSGGLLEAKELRGGAALVIAALAAEGESIITGCQFIYRGYEKIENDLRELGARVAGV